MARSPVRRSSRPPHRARSPRARSPRKSPRRRSPLGRRPASPRRRSPNRGGRRGPRSPPPRRGEGGGPGAGGGGPGGGGIGRKRRRKNRRNRGPRNRGGANGNLMTGGNTQPILASMRMRMDDYLPPKNRLLRDPRLDARGNDQNEKGGAGMEQVVMRARREATRNTKDIFWTKKLLDTEVEMPNRWAHSGFKELYKEELGYSDVEEGSGNEKNNGSRAGSRPRDPRDPSGALVPRKPTAGSRSPVNYPRSRSPRDPRRRPGSRSRSPRSPRRSPVRVGQRSPRRSPKRSPRKSPSRRSPRPVQGGDRRGRSRTPRSHKRRHSRSRSHSYSSSSSGSFSSSTGSSYSRSYSSYSRSSSGSSSSSFTSSTGSSISPPRRHGHSRGSFSVSPPPRHKAYTGSVSPRRGKIGKRLPPSASPTQVRMKQVTHKETTKKMVTKTVSNVVMTKSSASKKLKTKTKVKDGESLPPIRRKIPRLPPSGSPPPPGYYEDNGNMEAIEGGPAASNYRGPGTPPRGAPTEGGRHMLDPHHHRVVPPDHPDYHQTQARRESAHRSEGEDTDSDSTTDEDDRPRKMTLSERFGKLAQLSSQRQEYEGVRMKIVREGGQDKKVYLEGGRLHSRSPSPGRGRGSAHDRWLAEHQTEYAEYQERYGEIRQWDPHRDLPSELPPNWDDVNTRYRYYKDSGYFGDRNITLEDYLKWEDWWYRYRDWLEKYGNSQDERSWQYRNYDYEMHSPGARWGRAASREPDDRKRRRRRGKGKRRKAVVAAT